MAFGGDLVAKLGLDARAFVAGLTMAQNKLAAVGNGTVAQRGLRQGNEALNRINMSLGRTIVAANLATGGIQLLFAKLGEGVKLAAATEQLKLSFEVLSGSAQIGAALFAEMEKIAQSTSLTLAETTQAAKQLLISFDATQIPDLVKTLGNISSSFDNVTLQEMAWLLQTSRTEGKLLARDIRQFTTRGIPLVEALRDVMGIKGDNYGEQIMEMASLGEVRIEALMKALEKIGSNNMLERQGQTILGKWNQATDAVRFLIRDIGEATLNAFGIRDALDWVKDAAAGARDTLKEWLPVLNQVGATTQSFIGMFRDIGRTIGGVVTAAVGSFGISINDMLESLVGFFAAFQFGAEHWREGMLRIGLYGQLAMTVVYDHVNWLFANIESYLSWFGDNWRDVFRTAADFVRTVLANMGHNFGELFNQIYQNIRTMGAHGWDPVFVGLLDGFENAIQKLPDVPYFSSDKQARLEQEIAALEEQLGDGMSQAMHDAILRFREFVRPDVPGLGPKKPYEFPRGGSTGDQLPAALLQGTKEAYSAIVNSMQRDPVVAAIKDQTRMQREDAHMIAGMLTGIHPPVFAGFGQ